MRVFGSVARGEARADSDVDFLVEIEPGRNLLDRIALIQEIERDLPVLKGTVEAILLNLEEESPKNKGGN